jgi:YhgE/Pip-like protein
MKNVLLAFLKKPTTIVGIVAALMFQLIFSIVWMTGYNGITDNIEKLKVALVNEDQGIGKDIVKNLASTLPFQNASFDSLEKAQQALEHREVHLVVHIPANFSATLQSPDTAKIEYLINESNPAMIKNIMQGVIAKITATVNKEAVKMGTLNLLGQTKIAPEQATQLAEGLSERVVGETNSLNPVKNFAHQMIPMMLVLASYVGAMIMALNMHQSAAELGVQANRWLRFVVRGVINIVASVVIAFVGSSLIMALGGHVDQGFLAMWGFQSLFVMTFLFVAQIFLLLFGPAGMLFNIIMLSMQLVSSGAMVPRELLNGFFYELGKFLPATYAVEGNMNLLFGGPGIQDSSLALVLIMLVSIGIGLLSVAVIPEKKKQSNALPISAMVK